ALVQTNARLLSEGVFDVTEGDAPYLLGMFESQAWQFPLDGFFVGTADDAFMMVRRTGPGTLMRRVVMPAVNLQYRQEFADGHWGDRIPETLDYHPTQRDWFPIAHEKTAAWTNVYTFKTGGALGITASCAFSEHADNALSLLIKVASRADLQVSAPRAYEKLAAHPGKPLEKLHDPDIRGRAFAWHYAHDLWPGMDADPDIRVLANAAEMVEADLRPLLKGAVGIDVRLASLSEFLRRIDVSDNGTAFLLDQQNRLVAHPDMPANDVKLMAGTESGFDVVKQTIESLASVAADEQGMKRTSTSLKGQTWQVMLAPLDLGDGLPPLQLGVAVPEEDYMSDITANQIRSAVLALVAIVLGISLAFWVTRGIARPILQLEEAMSRVQRMDLDVNTDIPTNYIEIEQMVKSFESMVKGLHSFSRYVPRDVVLDLIASGQAAELGGEERELSMYFSDIIGFTSIAEATPTQELFRQLGEYFEEVTEVLRAHDGTLDKFIGDAVMAIWNAPRPIADHQLHCALAAIDVQAALTRANERWNFDGKPALDTRIGISTGHVMVGNVGSSHRLNYTALGDGVNLASRLEGANNYYGTRIIASEFLVGALPADRIVVQPLDILAVKGKATGVRIFEVLGRTGSVPGSRVQAAGIYAEGLEHYLARRFDQAKAKFAEVLRIMPGYLPAESFIARCDAYLKAPPPESWDGVYAMTKK
ncbi:MAG: adenylate/guanylate cyclase domain-containing protein, partial [Planctomycetota bacterium]